MTEQHPAPHPTSDASGPFRAGDRVQLSGPKGRLHTITLVPGESFHTHRGELKHDALIGLPEGSVVESSGGSRYLALRPLLQDFVMSMPRGAAIIYPKDASQILAIADVFPGATVVEAGVGSGALSLWLLRALGPDGTLHSFERREEFARIAHANVDAFFGAVPASWHLHLGDLAEELPQRVEPGTADRVILDMLAPWECVDAALGALRPGGVFVAYVATVPQLSRTVEELRASGRFTPPKSLEVMVRDWHVEGLAVRPDHRMIGHTGFLVSARALPEGVDLPQLSRRPPKEDFDEEDLERWTPGAVGERTTSEKKLRKTARRAEAEARLRNQAQE